MNINTYGFVHSSSCCLVMVNKLSLFLCTFLEQKWVLITLDRGALLAQLVKCRTHDRKVAGLNLTRGAVLCP